MPRKINRIILDTNLWISFLLTSDYSKLDTILSNQQVQLIFSKELLEEFVEVAQRPKFKKYFSNTDLTELLLQIKNVAEFIEVTTEVSICRDLKDNFLLALAKDGKADFLVTGDNDLLELKKFSNTRIVTISQFLKMKPGKI
jgi:putative PIN family toxin of toxin-antitoxin system